MEKKLVLFMTYGSSLKTWKDAGILDRELSLYRDHAANGIEIHVISYGDRTDLDLAQPYDFLSVHCNHSGLHPRLYAWMVPLVHRAILKRATYYKTNQLYGSHIARRCARLWKKPLVVRQGYGHYEHRVEEFGEASAQAGRALAYERAGLKAAQAAFFTTPELAHRARERHALPERNVHIVPNFVVPESWTPAFESKEPAEVLDLIFFGRFTEQKNLQSLLDAMTGLPVRLTLIGNGPEVDQLQKNARLKALDCRFLDRMPQKDLKTALRKADVFVLPSHYEGHPKSLLETMAFGMPVLAADSPGIREQVTDGETGCLAPPTPDGLKRGLERFLGMGREQRQALGTNARQYALSHYSVSSVAKLERRLLNQLMTGGAPR